MKIKFKKIFDHRFIILDGFDHASESTFSKETKRKRELLDISTILNPNVDYLIPKTWAGMLKKYKLLNQTYDISSLKEQ